jgi:hypothetical protein
VRDWDLVSVFCKWESSLPSTIWEQFSYIDKLALLESTAAMKRKGSQTLQRMWGILRISKALESRNLMEYSFLNIFYVSLTKKFFSSFTSQLLPNKYFK